MSQALVNVRYLPREARRLSWVLLAVATALVPHTTALPLWLVALVIGAGAWRLLVELRGWPLPQRWLRISLALLAVTGVLATYRTLNGLEAGTALLALMAGVKLLETRTVRDLSVLLLLAYFLLFAGFIYNQSLLQLPYMLTSAWLLTATLLRIHEAEASLRVKTALWTTGKMLLQAAPIAVLLFVFFPRLPGHFWAVPPRETARSGLGDEMTPGDISELSLSSGVAFRVHFNGEPPPPRERYWRGPVLHDFDGRTWRRVMQFAPPQSPVPQGPAYRYRITLEPHQRRWLFALDMATEWPTDRATKTFDFLLIAAQPIAAPTSYTLTSHTQYAVEGHLPASIRRMDTLLVTNRNPRSRALAQEMRAHAGSDAAYIEALLQKFRTEDFYYTLQPPTLASDSVDDFLFNTRRGFCEHFASAFTMMMRAAGIPARVVTGYQGGEYNAIGGYFIVRQSDAHAWSEVWLEDRGWVRVDPTAAVAPERVERGIDFAMGENEPVPGRLLRHSGLLMKLRHAWDAVNTFWNDSIVEYDTDLQHALLRVLGFDPSDWRTIGLTLVVLVMGLLATLAAYLRWRYGRRPLDPVVLIFDRLCRRLARCAPARQPHEGPRDYLERVARARPELQSSLRRFSELYLAARYGPASMAPNLKNLRDAARAVRV
jgi:transglutaminase-like putative cysteine protease